jgi:hypothetical protein
MTVKLGSYLSKLHAIEGKDAIVLAISAWNVITLPQTEMPATSGGLYLPDAVVYSIRYPNM